MAFVLVQHSGDIRLMRTVLDAVEKDLATTGSDGQQFAVLYDRTQLMLGRKQKFGTQIVGDGTGADVVAPLVEPNRVDEFRKQLGLPPLAEYLRSFNLQGDGNESAAEKSERK
jgi:hypothetical protein